MSCLQVKALDENRPVENVAIPLEGGKRMSITLCSAAVVAALVESVWELLSEPTLRDEWWDARAHETTTYTAIDVVSCRVQYG